MFMCSSATACPSGTTVKEPLIFSCNAARDNCGGVSSLHKYTTLEDCIFNADHRNRQFAAEDKLKEDDQENVALSG